MKNTVLLLFAIPLLLLISCKKDNHADEPNYSITISSLNKSQLTYTVSIKKLVNEEWLETDGMFIHEQYDESIEKKSLNTIIVQDVPKGKYIYVEVSVKDKSDYALLKVLKNGKVVFNEKSKELITFIEEVK